MKSWLLGVLRQLKPGAPRAAHQRLAGNLLKYGIMIAAISYIVWRLDREDSSVWDMLAGMNAQSWILVALAFVLIFLNLGLEAMKWRTMVRPVYPDLTLQKAFGAVVVGITAGIFTPNGIGAYAGRVFWLKAGKRWEAAVLTLGDRLCQMTITLWTALFALEAIRLSHAEILEVLPQGPLQGGRILLWVTSGIALLLILFPQSMYRTILWIGANGKISGKIASAFAEVKRPLLAKVLLLGLLRYATFSLQYLILLYAFGYAGSMMLGVGLIGLVFFIKSLLPSISFSELGVRESVALVVMGAAGIAAPTAVAATFVLYLFNQIVPALAGLLLAPRLRVD